MVRSGTCIPFRLKCLPISQNCLCCFCLRIPISAMISKLYFLRGGLIRLEVWNTLEVSFGQFFVTKSISCGPLVVTIVRFLVFRTLRGLLQSGQVVSFGSRRMMSGEHDTDNELLEGGGVNETDFPQLTLRERNTDNIEAFFHLVG